MQKNEVQNYEVQKYEVLKKYFGYDEFRTGQEELIDAILNGQDVLGIMPTGAGKSLCYQVPAMILPGITLVISPLISLMLDQVKALNQAGVHAAYINSALTEGQISKALQNAREGRYKIIYVAPERLETDSFLWFAGHVQISMVTVDEAHCISQWGQDFRPSYLKIVRFIEQLEQRPIVSAFTATATQVVKEDIVCVLGLRDPRTLVTGFDRENLYFEVKQVKKKDAELLAYVTMHSGDSGIIYCATRKNVDNVCTYLEEMGIDATRYHAGMGAEERKRSQEDFIYDVKPVMVATNAFGMGIDKSNVRYVIHYNMPQSLENYYQEAGRAGRDGEPSECIILYSPQDVMINKFLIGNKGENQEYTWEQLESLRENDEARLRAMTGYCTTKKCLREYILKYFGDFNSGNANCGNCSNCFTEFEEADVTEIASDVIRCIRECGQRYGMNVIAGVLRGENKAKLRSYGLTDLSSFGLRKGMREEYLKNIINEMVTEGFLSTTQDKYMLLKLTAAAGEVMEGGRKVVVRCLPQPAGEQGGYASDAGGSSAGENAGSKSARKQRISDILTTNGLQLFDRLREKRLEIAREEAVPPYIVFSDKTLLDMCIKVPLSAQEMLEVTGVGENKYERYGEKFISCIDEFCGGVPQIYYYPEEDGSAPAVETGRGGKTSSKGKAKGADEAAGSPGGTLVLKGAASGSGRTKQEFILTEEIAEQLHFSDKTTLSDLVGQMNDLRDEASMKRLTNKAVMQRLISENYLEEKYYNGICRKKVLEKGDALGIFTEKRVSQAGNEYEVLYYNEKAQKAIVNKLLDDWKDVMGAVVQD